MFLGAHTPKLDEKGRVILPAKFREGLTGGLVMTKGQERCVIIWPREAFDTYAAELRRRSTNNEKVRAYTRCRKCGRARSVFRKFGLCRVCLREMAHAGEIPGVTKASW